MVAFAKLGAPPHREVPARRRGAAPSRCMLRWEPSDARLARRRARAWSPPRAAPARLSPCCESVLVANRGEIARRIIRACRALGVRTVAVYSEADADWPHVARRRRGRPHRARARARELSRRRARPRGRAPDGRRGRSIPATGSSPRTGASPRPARTAGLVFVGPSWRVIQQMGDKVGARRLDGGGGRAGGAGQRRARRTRSRPRAEVAGRIGYPVMLKAAAGGGGIGMMRVADEAGAGRRVRDGRAARAGRVRLGARSSWSATSRRPATSRSRSSATTGGPRGPSPRARVLDPAAAPEAGRGEPRAAPVRGPEGAASPRPR